MSKVVIFWTYIPKFFGDLFFRHPQIFFRLYRPKKIFLDFLDLKISLNPLKTLRKHLFSLQIDEINNIFLDFIAKNCPNYYLHTCRRFHKILLRKLCTNVRTFSLDNLNAVL